MSNLKEPKRFLGVPQDGENTVVDKTYAQTPIQLTLRSPRLFSPVSPLLIAMTQTFAPSQHSLASKSTLRILCCYTNVASEIQTIQITNIPNLYLKRVIFPGERVMFESLQDAELEIQSSESTTLRVPCQQLRVNASY